MSASAFSELNASCVERFYRSHPYRTWHGFRLLAIDGTTLRLDSVDAACREHFHPASKRSPGECALARASQCFDVLNHLCLDAIIDSYEVGERTLAMSHTGVFTSNDLTLLDRGYPAFWFIAQLLSLGTNFCMRVAAET